jgi:hypothetical protein
MRAGSRGHDDMGGGNNSDMGQLATAAAMVGDGSCKGRQWQAKVAAAMVTVMAGDISWDGGQRRAKTAVKTGNGSFLDGEQRPLHQK